MSCNDGTRRFGDRTVVTLKVEQKMLSFLKESKSDIEHCLPIPLSDPSISHGEKEDEEPLIMSLPDVHHEKPEMPIEYQREMLPEEGLKNTIIERTSDIYDLE
jgi:hypothetical protein